MNTTVLENPKTKDKLELAVFKYLQNKEMVKERNEENKILYEDIEDYFRELKEESVIFDLPTGIKIEVKASHSVREVLDKDSLAEEMQISKDDLKTPFDFSKLTELGKLTPSMVTRHTEIKKNSKVRIKNAKKAKKRV
jgi:hypothetical protein